MSTLKPVAWLFGMLLVSGCSGFRSSEATTQIYDLMPVPPPAVPGSAASATLKLVSVLVDPGLDTARIALSRDGQQLDYYAHSQWAAPLPQMVRARALAALRATGRFRMVQDEGTPFVADYLLQLEIRLFQADYAGAAQPTIRVQLVATLGRTGDRAALASWVVEHDVVAGANRMQAVTAAFESALGATLTELATQVVPP